MNETIGFIIAILIIGLFFYLMIKEWKSEWRGKLVDKRIVNETDDEGYSQRKRKLFFEIEEGKTKSISVGRKEYNNANLGDEYYKKSGSFKPKKVV